MVEINHRVLQVLIAINQFFTALFGGWADETMSSYAYRMDQEGKPWGFMRKVIDWLFSWQMEEHCKDAYMAEWERRQQPPIFRDVTWFTDEDKRGQQQ